LGGNLKFDFRPPRTAHFTEQLRGRLPQGARVLVAGSTLDDEESVLLEAWPLICERAPNAVMVLAPRHPERFAKVAALAREKQARVIERSKWDGGPVSAGSVLLLDSIGELGSVYSLASVAFVGGSLVAAGGHNPLEAALFGVPVVMGSHYENFREPVELLRAADGLRVVERGDVAAVIAGLMQDPGASQAVGERAKKAIEAQAGATQRAAAAVVRLLTEGNA
jgi:3-deoxy-D-manno-octulosonic-acid transferase